MGPVLSILSNALLNQLASRVLSKNNLNGAEVVGSALNSYAQDKLRSNLGAKTEDLINHGV